MTPALSDLIDRSRAAGRIADADVVAMRGEVYGADTVAPDEMAALLALDGVLAMRTPSWANFLYDAMSDAMLRQTDPQGYIDDGEAASVMQAMGAAPAVDGALGALARVIAEADAVPASLESYALAKAKAAVTSVGAVSAADVDMLRRLVFAGGGEGALGVTRAEADALFDINNACHEAANDPAWADFFGKAIADSLTAVSPFAAPSREQETADEAWLTQKPTLGGFLGGMAKTPNVGGFVRDLPDILDPFRTEANEWVDANAAIDRDEAAAAEITDEEARWLVGRLSQSRLNDAERALIAALRESAGPVSQLLQPLLVGAPQAPSPAVAAKAAPAQAAATPSDTPAAPVFGHRKAMPG